MYDTETCIVLHYGSNKYKKVPREVMEAKTMELVLGFSFSNLARNFSKKLTSQTLRLREMIESKTCFNIVAKYVQTIERRIHIDDVALHQIYSEGKYLYIVPIFGAENPADSLTKPGLSETSPLLNVIGSNPFELRSSGLATSQKTKFLNC